MDQDDAVMIFPGLREAMRGLDEVGHVEGHEHAALARGLPQETIISELLQRRSARGRDDIVA